MPPDDNNRNASTPIRRDLRTQSAEDLAFAGARTFREFHDRLRALARENLTCKRCGRTFTPKRSDAKYCSEACKQAAYRTRKG